MANLNSQIKEEITLDFERWKQRRLKLGKNKSEGNVAAGDLVMLRRDKKNEQAQFRLVLEFLNQNREAVVRLQSGYSLITAVGNLIPVASGQSDGRELQGNMNRVGKQFSHFISLSISGDKDLDLIKAFQEKCQALGRRKIPIKCTSLLGASISRKTKWRKLR